MKRILDYEIEPEEAAVWWLGQAGYVVRSRGVTAAIDPYLSDSVARIAPEFGRLYPPPIDPAELMVDVVVITHDHLDHLDPETLGPYAHKDRTTFVAPRLAARTLSGLGIPQTNIRRIDIGERETVLDGVTVTGIYAVPTGPDALDTTGYLVELPNGRSVYHTSDTAYSELLLRSAPHAETLLVCINGKWGNLNVHQAVELACAVKPTHAVPNHYDLMALNSENPRTFEFFMRQAAPEIGVRILDVMQPFVWPAQ